MITYHQNNLMKPLSHYNSHAIANLATIYNYSACSNLKKKRVTL